MPKQKFVVLIVAVVLALVAVFLVKAYLDQQRQLYLDQAQKELNKATEAIKVNQTAVVVAKQNIPSGTIIAPEMLDLRVVPNQQLKPNAANTLDKIVGMATRESIARGEQITMDKLSPATKKEGGSFSAVGSLSQFTPVGKRAITVNVDNITGLAGMLKPGDYVDVLATLPFPSRSPEGKQTTQVATIPLFQNILVLAVGQETMATVQDPRYREGKKAGDQAASLITLALTPQEASLIAFAQEQGKIRLVLRSPTDAQLQPVQPASWDTLFNYIMPEEQKKAKAKAEQVPTVEVYRGLTKEQVPLQ